MFKVCECVCGIMLPYTMPIGRRVRLEHFGGMVLSGRRIGSDVVMRQNTTLGIISVQDLDARPVIGDYVDIGAGAVILGDITLGDGVIVGANAVVTRPVPAWAVVGGVPARLIRMRTPPGDTPMGSVATNDTMYDIADQTL
jgi:serine O-acetyltransferase